MKNPSKIKHAILNILLGLFFLVMAAVAGSGTGLGAESKPVLAVPKKPVTEKLQSAAPVSSGNMVMINPQPEPPGKEKQVDR